MSLCIFKRLLECRVINEKPNKEIVGRLEMKEGLCTTNIMKLGIWCCVGHNISQDVYGNIDFIKKNKEKKKKKKSAVIAVKGIRCWPVVILIQCVSQ